MILVFDAWLAWHGLRSNIRDSLTVDLNLCLFINAREPSPCAVVIGRWRKKYDYHLLIVGI